MADMFTKSKRSEIMSKIRSKDTSPEYQVRKLLFSNGFRYRLHCKDLPGKPDIVISKLKVVLFVNGCFWHQHQGCKLKKLPKSNVDYWREKLARNVQRQKEEITELRKLGWDTGIVWECETRDKAKLNERLSEIMKPIDFKRN